MEIKPDSVIYCDIPYKNTNAYGEVNKNNFDYERFYSWCEKQKEFVIVSEYQMPLDRFKCIGEVEKPVMMNSGAEKKTIEKLFIPKRQIDKYREYLLNKGGYLFAPT